MGRRLSDVDKKYLLTLETKNINFALLLSLFSERVTRTGSSLKKQEGRMKSSDEFTLAPGEYFNQGKILTNAGLFIYNKLIIEEKFQKITGYINDPINSSVLNKIEDKLSKALLNDKITVADFVQYLNRIQWLAMKLHAVICGSFTMKTLKPDPKVIAERNRLLKANRADIDAGDVITVAKIEKTLLDMADKELGDDHGLDLYRSGARGSFGNNFKNISVMKGPIFNPSTGKYDIIENSLMEGIKKKDLPVLANAIITGAYPKAIGTATSGYFSKQIIAALQAVVLDKVGSDCGTKAYLDIIIPEKSSNDFLYRYIIEGTKYVLLDDDNISKYAGQRVKMRSPMYCINKNLCRICAGAMYDKLEINNIGLTAARVSSTMLNLSMKKFHISTVQITEIKPENMIL